MCRETSAEPCRLAAGADAKGDRQSGGPEVNASSYQASFLRHNWELGHFLDEVPAYYGKLPAKMNMLPVSNLAPLPELQMQQS